MVAFWGRGNNTVCHLKADALGDLESWFPSLGRDLLWPPCFCEDHMRA